MGINVSAVWSRKVVCTVLGVLGDDNTTFSLRIDQCFSTWGNFVPQGIFSNVWRNFWLSQLLGGKGMGC